MGIRDFLSKQFIDVIHWTESEDGVLAYRFPMQDMEIQNGAKLTVRESQMAAFVNEGRMADVLGPRPGAVARELTKMFEETRRETLPALAAHYAQAGAPKGEIVIVVGPPLEAEITDDVLDAFLRDALMRGGVKEAASEAAKALGVPRKRAYQRALELKA